MFKKFISWLRNDTATKKTLPLGLKLLTVLEVVAVKEDVIAIVHIKEVTDEKAQIATQAYYRAEARGFISGHELEDWFGAEQEVKHQIWLNNFRRR